MLNKILHIGLPKTSTTYLQNNVFRKICEIENLNYLGKGSDYSKKENHELFHLKYSITHEFEPTKINLGENFFASHEGLTGSDPFFWETAAEKILNSINSDLTILLVIRKPKDLINSSYIEDCYAKGYFVRPERFFLDNKNYKLSSNFPKYNIDYLSYENLSKFFYERFKKVIIIKYEHLYEDKLLSAALEFSDLSNQVIINRPLYKSNKSFSERGIKILTSLNKMLNRFGLKLGYKKDNSLIEDYSIKNLAAKMKKIKKEKKFEFRFNFIEFYRNYVDKYFGNKKFEVKLNDILLAKLKVLEYEYSKIPKLSIYINGNKEK